MISDNRIKEIFNASKTILNDLNFEEYFTHLKCSYTDDELERGYAIISDHIGHGAKRIKAIPILGRCTTDIEAMKCAKQDGIKLIEDLVFNNNHSAFYIDTPENREILQPLIQHNPSAKIIVTNNGKKTVEIQNIKFRGKRKIDWKSVEDYLKKYIGSQFIIYENGKTVNIGSDFPDEYANSKDTINCLGTNGKAKANASQAIPELIQTLSEIKFYPNLDAKHNADAPNGWLRGTVNFSLSVTNDKGEIIGTNSFRGRMVIRCNKENKLYLYDIVTIKKKRSTPLKQKLYGSA